MATNNANDFSNPVGVVNGGSSASSQTAYAILCGGTTSTGPIQSIASVGSSTNVLTSNGAGALPTFQAAAGGSAVGIGGITNNWYPSGSIWNGTGAATQGTSTVTGTLYFSPFFVSKTTVYKKIGILLGSTAAGTSVLGIYNDSGNGKPTGSPIANSNSTSLTNTANTFSSYTFGATISLSPGTYWCAFSTLLTSTFTSPVPGGYEIGGRGLGVQATPTTTNIIAPQAGWSQTFVYSATLPAVGTLAVVACYAVGDTFIFLQAN